MGLRLMHLCGREPAFPTREGLALRTTSLETFGWAAEDRSSPGCRRDGILCIPEQYYPRRVRVHALLCYEFAFRVRMRDAIATFLMNKTWSCVFTIFSAILIHFTWSKTAFAVFAWPGL